MSNAIIQTNVRLSDDLIKRAKIDSLRLDVSLQEYFAKAIDSFASKNLSAKRVIFEKSQRKILGRKISFPQKNFATGNGVKPAKQGNG